jgi:hypothetical protein
MSSTVSEDVEKNAPAHAKTFLGEALISSLNPIPGLSGVMMRKPKEVATSS